MADDTLRACAVCRAPLKDDRSPLMLRNSLVSLKRYCSAKCTRRACYLRRKERDASSPVVIDNPVAIQPTGWPAAHPTNLENMTHPAPGEQTPGTALETNPA